jgi:hypothetical protein
MEARVDTNQELLKQMAGESSRASLVEKVPAQFSFSKLFEQDTNPIEVRSARGPFSINREAFAGVTAQNGAVNTARFENSAIPALSMSANPDVKNTFPFALPWVAAMTGSGAAAFFGRNERWRRAGKLGLMAGATLAEGACAPITVAETAVAQISAEKQRASIVSVLQPWEGRMVDGYTITELETQENFYTQPLLVATDTTTQKAFDGKYVIANIDSVNGQDKSQRQLFLIGMNAKGEAVNAFNIDFPGQQPTEAAGFTTNAELRNAKDTKVADIYFNAELGNADAPFATIKYLSPTPVPNSEIPVQYVELRFPATATPEQKKNFIDEMMERTLTGNVLAAEPGTIPAGTKTPTPTKEAPTATPTEAKQYDAATGWEMRMVDGEKQLFSPDINAWVVSGGRTPLLEQDEREYLLNGDIMRLEVYYKVGEQGPSISQNLPANKEDLTDFTGMFLDKLATRYYGRGQSLTEEFKQNLKGDGFTFTFTTPEGEQTFKVNKNSMYRVYVMPYDEVANEAGYQEQFDSISNSRFRSVTRADGTNVISLVGSEKPVNSLAEDRFLKMIFISLAQVMDPKQSPALYSNPPQAYSNAIMMDLLKEAKESFKVE